MTLRRFLLACTLCLFAFQAFSSVLLVKEPQTSLAPSAEQMQQMQAVLGTLSSQDLATLSISQVEGLTGHKMNFKEKVAFKIAKMKMKKMKRKMTAEMKSADGIAEAPGIDKMLYIILSIFVLPFLAVGLATNWEGNDWLWCLLLTFLCWLPGLIYALMKMKKYYA